MTQHTKEPWRLVSLGECFWGDNYPGHMDIEGADGTTVNPTPYPIDSPDAKRIVACVNACADLDDPEADITNMIDAAKYPANLRQDKAELLEILENLVERADRARSILTKGKNDEWLMLETSTAKAAIAKAGEES